MPLKIRATHLRRVLLVLGMFVVCNIYLTVLMYIILPSNRQEVTESAAGSVKNDPCFPEGRHEQQEPCLISFVKRSLIPPSDPPYTPPVNITHDKQPAIAEELEFLQKHFIDTGLTSPGFFIECGMNNLEYISPTLNLEQKYKWSGLLIQANPRPFRRLVKTNRNAWTLNHCICPTTYSSKLRFHNIPGDTGREFDRTEDQLESLEVTCVPIFTILAAMNMTTVDYFSLDMDGFELAILETIPLDKVIFKMLTVAHYLSPGFQPALVKFLEGKGYKFVGTLLDHYTRKSLFVHVSVYSSNMTLKIMFDPSDSRTIPAEKTDLTFVKAMESIPWTAYKNSFEKGWTPVIQRYSELILQKLLPFVTKSPRIPVNESCVEPPLQPLTVLDCNRLEKPRRVGMIWQFGFDVDALEIHLHELDSLVDKFFILESIHSHGAHLTLVKKPLIWDTLKFDQRFAKFSHKIVHFIVDDASLTTVNHSGVWYREMQQVELRWLKFLEWNNLTKYFDSDDLLGIGDVDEIPSRDNVHFMKNCQLPSDPIDIGVWFPMRDISTMYAPDYPVPGHPLSLAEPTFWTLGAAQKYYQISTKAPTKNSGKRPSYLLGGIHMSKYPYPPFQMLKLLTMTEVSMVQINLAIEAGILFTLGKVSEAEARLNNLPIDWARRVHKLVELRERHREEVDAIVKVPWFLNCNWKRYPSFYKCHDSRQDA